MKKRVCDSASDLSSFPTVYDAMLPRSVKIENEEIYRTRSRAQSVGGAGLSENTSIEPLYLYRTQKLIPNSV
jgi:hypothetical protein